MRLTADDDWSKIIIYENGGNPRVAVSGSFTRFSIALGCMEFEVDGRSQSIFARGGETS